MKKIYLLLDCLIIMAIACGTQMPTVPSTEVKAPSNDVSLPVKVAEAAEPTESPVIYVTTAPLNVRSEASANSTILGTLEAGTVIQIFITDEPSDGCYLGEWYQIFYKPKGGETTKAFVCSLWVVRK